MKEQVTLKKIKFLKFNNVIFFNLKVNYIVIDLRNKI